MYTASGLEVLSDDPTAYYRLGEFPVARAFLGGLDGTYVNVGDGGLGIALLDGGADLRGGTSSQIETPHNPALSLNSFSLEGWVKPRSYTTGYGAGLIHKGSSGGAPEHELYPGPCRLTITPTGRVNFAFQWGSGAAEKYSLTTPDVPAGKAPLNVWTHVVGTYDGSTMRTYVNGAFQNSLAAPNAPLSNTKSLWIGARKDGGRLDGFLDEVALYSNALPATRIQAHFNAAFLSSYASEVQVDGPTLYYRLSDAPRLNDNSGSNANGTYLDYDAATLGQPGGVCCDGNTAATFRNLGRGEVTGATPAVNQADDFSIEAWVKPAIVSGTHSIVSKGATGANGGNYWLLTYGDDFNFWYQENVGGPVVNRILQWPTYQSIVTGQWYHIVATYDKCAEGQPSCEARLYVNGVLQAVRSTVGGSPVTNSSPFRIGQSSNTSYSIAGGTVDDVAIFDQALTADRVLSHYEDG